MIGFVSRAKARVTAPRRDSRAIASASPGAGPGPVAGREASVGRITPAGRDAGQDAAAGRIPPAGRDAGQDVAIGRITPAGRDAAAGRIPPAGRDAGKDASVGRNTPVGKDAAADRITPAGKDAYAGATGNTGAAGNTSAPGNTGAPGNAGNRSSADGEPSGRAPGTFIGAALPICGIDVLIVVVHPWVLADIHEANLYVVAFHERFRRRIVLTAQGTDGTPCFYGPTEIIRVLRGLPFEMIPWRRLLFRTAPPPARRLPIPPPRGGSERPNTEHIDGADSAAITQRDASAAITVHARPASSTDDTTPHRRDSRARRADRTTAH